MFRRSWRLSLWVGAGSGHDALGLRSQVLVNSQLSFHSGSVHDWGMPQFPQSALQFLG